MRALLVSLMFFWSSIALSANLIPLTEINIQSDESLFERKGSVKPLRFQKKSIRKYFGWLPAPFLCNTFKIHKAINKKMVWLASGEFLIKSFNVQ